MLRDMDIVVPIQVDAKGVENIKTYSFMKKKKMQRKTLFQKKSNKESVSHISEESCSSSSSRSSYAQITGDSMANLASLPQGGKLLKDSPKLTHRALYKKMKEEQDMKERKEKAFETMKYLLSTSKEYSKSFLSKLQKEQNRNKADQCNVYEKYGSRKDTKGSPYELYNNNSVGASNMKLKYFEGGTLREYQMEGLLWLKLLFENGINGILADEMGLGKTVQVIALICYLLEQKVPGPFLIVAPLSTIPNWMSEWKRFAPRVPVVLFHGSRSERAQQYPAVSKEYVLDGLKIAPVVLTSYQVPLLECSFLQRYKWQYLVIDEGHRIKNMQCQLGRVLRSLVSLNRLLLTGTPLQNNLVELWSLLNFLMPQLFEDINAFSALLMKEDLEATDRIIKQEESTNIISTIHSVLAPFMLRRLKSEVLDDSVPKKEVLVYCPLSKLQRDLYSYILQRNIDKLLGKEKPVELEETTPSKRPKRLSTRIKTKKYVEENSDEEFPDGKSWAQAEYGGMSKRDTRTIICNIKMANPMMMLKKVVNHPYLVHFPLQPGTTNELLISEDLVKQSGKLMVLDALLPQLQMRGHKVLLFSTLTCLLDMVEDYMIMREYGYCRLDGSHKLAKRDFNITQFNSDPKKFVFLISTRAGGLGLNLTSADTVILFDKDWNPQADIQAQDRCHRIGQTKPVVVYTFVTKGTIDESILKTATTKRRLEKIVIKNGKFRDPSLKETVTDLEELKKLLESVDHQEVAQTSADVFSRAELRAMVDRSDLYREMKRKQAILNHPKSS